MNQIDTPPRTGPLRKRIEAAARQPFGVARLEVAPEAEQKDAFSKCVVRLARLGLLHRRKVPGHPPHWFASADDGDAWKAATPPQLKGYVPAPPKPPKPEKAKAVKVAKPKKVAVVKVKVLLVHQKIYHLTRGPVAPVKPTKAAVIVWPENVKHTIVPPHPPRNFMVSHSFVHSGMGAM